MTSNLITDLPPNLAVVPIVVNAGAAVLPALIAALASFVALLLKPRELLRACRRRPLVTASILAAIVVIVVGTRIILALPAAPKPVIQRDIWNDLALQLISGQSAASTQSILTNQPIGLGRTFARTGCDGGPSPTQLSAIPVWSVETEGYVLSSPAVRGTRVYAASCLIDITGQTGAVFCYDIDHSAKPLWRTDLDNAGASFKPFFSSPSLTADGKYLLIGQGLHEDRNCALLCFDADTGKLLWSSPTPLHIESSPAIFTHPEYGDVAVVGCGAIEGPNHSAPTDDIGHVIAVQIATGKLLWKYALADPESSPAASPDGRTVYIGSGFNGNAVVALRTDTDEDLAAEAQLPSSMPASMPSSMPAAALPPSRLLWKTPTPYPATGAVTLITPPHEPSLPRTGPTPPITNYQLPVAPPPPPCNPTLLIGCGNSDFVVSDPNPRGAVLALDATTGAVLWQQDTPDAVLGEIAARKNLVIAPCKSGSLMAFDLATGKPLWSVAISGTSPILAGVAFTEHRIYAVSKDGTLAVIDPAPTNPAKRILEKLFINDPSHPGDQGLCLSAPTIAGGRLYIGSETGGLRCLAGQKLLAPHAP